MPSELRVDKVSSTASPYTPVFSTTGGALSHRNLIINGGMQVAQRATTSTSNRNSGYQCVDRFRCQETNLGNIAIVQSQYAMSSAELNDTGQSKAFKMDVNTAESAIGASEKWSIDYRFEGQDLQHLQYGTANAQSVTLSFWAKSNVAGVYGISMLQTDGAKRIGSTYTLASNVWKKVSITFIGNTADLIVNDNTQGLEITWGLLVGSDYTGGTNTSWGATANNKYFNGHTAVWGTSTSDDFYLTGVQLELGTVATPFEHRSYGDELQRCKRYYQELFGNGYNYHAHTVWFPNASQWSLALMYPEEMRTTPTSSIVGTAVNSTDGSYSANNWGVYAASGWRGCSSIGLNSTSPVSIRVDGNTNNTVSAGVAGGLYGGTSCYVTLNAEL